MHSELKGRVRVGVPRGSPWSALQLSGEVQREVLVRQGRVGREWAGLTGPRAARPLVVSASRAEGEVLQAAEREYEM